LIEKKQRQALSSTKIFDDRKDRKESKGIDHGAFAPQKYNIRKYHKESILYPSMNSHSIGMGEREGNEMNGEPERTTKVYSVSSKRIGGEAEQNGE